MRYGEDHEKRVAQRRAQYEREDVNGKLVINLRDISHIMRDLSEGRGSQKRILIILLEAGPITQRELTQRLGIQPGSASEVITKLETAGLISRTESEADHRTVDITLTEEGSRQARDAKSQRDGRHGEMFSALSGEEKSHLLRLLEKVNTDWESRYADRQRHCRSHHEGHGRHGLPSVREGRERCGEVGGEDRFHCDHDCQSCPNPCGRGRAFREGGR